MADKKKNKGSEISNLEWGMVISILAIIDLIQFVLDLIGVPLVATLGTLVNRFITFGTGLAWPTYLKLRGVNLNAPRVLAFGLGLFFESLPTLDVMPFWFLDGLIMMASVKAEKKLAKVAGVAVAAAAVAAAPETGGASLAAGEAAEGALAAEEGAAAGEELASARQGEEAGAEAEEGLDDESEEYDGEEPSDDDQSDESQPSQSNNENRQPNRSSDSSRDQRSQPKRAGLNQRSSSMSQTEDESASGDEDDNTLDLRGGAAAKERAEKDRKLGALKNITDLSLSYGQRKKAKEDEGSSLTE